jgi:glycosidase
MVSEVWAGENVIADYYNSITPSMFNFDIAQAEGKLIRAGNGKFKAEKLVEAMVKYQEDFGANNPDYIDAPFLTNHDMPRVANALNNNPEALKRAAGLLMTMNGAPFVYYGEEIGMCSKGTKDENKRLPMIWSSTEEVEGTTRKPADADSGITSSFEGVEEQLADPDSILNYYRRAIRLRNENPELARGYITIVDELTEDNTAVIIKAWNDSAIAVVYNTSDEEVRLEISKVGSMNVIQKNGSLESMDFDLSTASLYGFLTVDITEEVRLDNGVLFVPAGGIAILR